MTWLATGKAPWKSDRPSFGCSSDLYMKTSPALLAALLLSSAIALGAPSTNDLAGNWQGALEVGQAKLRLLFRSIYEDIPSTSRRTSALVRHCLGRSLHQ